jgi:3-dehydroquinate dehydratase/shikimate dehydrogenase
MLIQVVLADSTDQLIRDYAAAAPEADLVELRLDRVRDLDLPRILSAAGKPRVATCRSRAQGGFFGGAEEERQSILKEAVRLGAEYVDLEFDSEDEQLLGRTGKARPILSWHHRGGTPVDLEPIVRRMAERGPGAILKVIPFADSSTDNLRVRTLLAAARHEKRDLIAFCMGERGKASRILARAWGSWAVYAPATERAQTAPGQLLLSDLADLYRYRGLTGTTPLTGILGYPLSHSLSPLLHNRAYAELGMERCFIPFETEQVGEFLPLLSELPVAGLAVTLPHKVTLVSYCDELDPVAARVGAVNTVVRRWNRLVGYNTDVEGGIEPLRRRLALKGARIGILGAGGAARALAWGLSREGSEVVLFARHRAGGESVAAALGVKAEAWSKGRAFRGQVLINATPVGMDPAPEESPVSWDGIRAEVAYDLVYRPALTRFLREAREAGITIIGGMEMFLEQALRQFEILNGQAAPRALFESILNPPTPPPGERSS